MTWLRHYRLRRKLRSSLWLMPVLASLAALMIAPFVRWLDHTTGWTLLNLTPEGARTILGAFTSSMLTFVVFVVSSLLIVVQLASAQLTPRIIARVFADNHLKVALSLFTFAYTYTVVASGRIGDTVPQLHVALAIASSLGSIAVFFWFVEWLGSSLRPIAVLQSVADEGLTVVQGIYPDRFDPSERQAGWHLDRDVSAVEIEHVGRSGVVLAFGPAALLALAEEADAIIELMPQVGDFVAKGDVLFRVHTAGRPLDPGALRDCVAIGPERTMEQDPRFAFRIMVDIANKGLSPAINDPTTAVLALDQLQHLLMHVGKRRLDAGQTHDRQGRLRFCFGTPNWTDYVSLAVTEIRQYGGNSMQVVRRLQAMLEHLLRVLPAARRPALEQELSLLQLDTQRLFADEVDRSRAQVADVQGIGGSR
jgi:uncharacterized membrane protein